MILVKYFFSKIVVLMFILHLESSAAPMLRNSSDSHLYWLKNRSQQKNLDTSVNRKMAQMYDTESQFNDRLNNDIKCHSATVAVPQEKRSGGEMARVRDIDAACEMARKQAKYSRGSQIMAEHRDIEESSEKALSSDFPEKRLRLRLVRNKERHRRFRRNFIYEGNYYKDLTHDEEVRDFKIKTLDELGKEWWKKLVRRSRRSLAEHSGKSENKALHQWDTIASKRSNATTHDIQVGTEKNRITKRRVNDIKRLFGKSVAHRSRKMEKAGKALSAANRALMKLGKTVLEAEHRQEAINELVAKKRSLSVKQQKSDVRDTESNLNVTDLKSSVSVSRDVEKVKIPAAADKNTSTVVDASADGIVEAAGVVSDVEAVISKTGVRQAPVARDLKTTTAATVVASVIAASHENIVNYAGVNDVDKTYDDVDSDIFDDVMNDAFYDKKFVDDARAARTMGRREEVGFDHFYGPNPSVRKLASTGAGGGPYRRESAETRDANKEIDAEEEETSRTEEADNFGINLAQENDVYFKREAGVRRYLPLEEMDYTAVGKREITPEEKADNFEMSQKLVEILIEQVYNKLQISDVPRVGGLQDVVLNKVQGVRTRPPSEAARGRVVDLPMYKDTKAGNETSRNTTTSGMSTARPTTKRPTKKHAVLASRRLHRRYSRSPGREDAEESGHVTKTESLNEIARYRDVSGSMRVRREVTDTKDFSPGLKLATSKVMEAVESVLYCRVIRRLVAEKKASEEAYKTLFVKGDCFDFDAPKR